MPIATTVVVVATEPSTRYITAICTRTASTGSAPGQDQADHRSGQEHDADRLRRLDLGHQRGARRRAQERLRRRCATSSPARAAPRPRHGGPTAPPRSGARPAPSTASELPITMPASGTTVRPSTGNTDSPNSTPRLTRHEAPYATQAEHQHTRHLGARRWVVHAANTTITADPHPAVDDRLARVDDQLERDADRAAAAPAHAATPTGSTVPGPAAATSRWRPRSPPASPLAASPR